MKTLVFLLLVAVAHSKVFERCEWAGVLKDNGFDGLRGYNLSNWVCLTWYESRYNTQAINHNRKSSDYGIFQINSRYWCQDNKTRGAKNVCGIQCSDLLNDDVDDDIRCAKRVARDPNGITAWYGWRDNCRGKDLTPFVAGCVV